MKIHDLAAASAFYSDVRVTWPSAGWPPDVLAVVSDTGFGGDQVVMWSGSTYLTRPAVPAGGDPYADDVVGFGSVDDAIWSLIGDPA